MTNETMCAFARCTTGECKYEVASAEPDSAITFVAAAFVRHQREAHGVKAARP